MSRVPHALLIGFAVAVMAGSVWLLGHTQRQAATRSFAQTEHAQAMLAAMLDQETGLRGFLLNRRTDWAIRTYLATGLERRSLPAEAGEVIESAFEPVDDVDGMIRDGELDNTVVLSGWAMLRASGALDDPGD